MGKDICIIGAGASGLTTIKQLLDEGHNPICFDKAADLGGLFNSKEAFDGKRGSVYKNTVLTISNYQMAFSDFSPKEHRRVHWHHYQYLQYLRDYALEYSLDRFIKFSTQVLSVAEKGDRWVVTVKCNNSGDVLDYECDGVAICTGTHQVPSIPQFEKSDEFKGEIVHSSQYMEGDAFRDKKVVVIGIGESSADIVREISDVSKECHLLIRNYPVLVPRNQQHEAADANTSRALSSFSYPSSTLLKVYLFACATVAKVTNSVLKLLGLNKKPALDSFNQSTDMSFLDHSVPHEVEAVKLIKSWSILGGATPERKFATKNVTFVKNIVSGKIDVHKDEIAEFYDHGIITKSGQKIPCDTVMLCTGYKESFGFLKDHQVEDNNVRNLYLNAFHPKMKNVAFIGWNRPSLGAIPACSEMIARYYALILSGKRQLPHNIELLIKQHKKEKDERFKFSPNILTVVDYHEFMTTLSKLIGCQIEWSRYVLRPAMLYKLVFGGHMSAQYRITGPHAMTEQSEKVISRLPVSPVIQNLSMKLALGQLIGARVQNNVSHKQLINKLFLPGIEVSDDDIERYAFKPNANDDVNTATSEIEEEKLAV